MQMQPIDITRIIVAIINAAVVVYSVKKRLEQKRLEQTLLEQKDLEQQDLEQQESQKPEGEPRKISPWTIVMGVSLILLAANLGVFGWQYWRPTTKLEITYPHDGANVEISETVRGTSEKIPEGQAIWIMVYPHVIGRYYPNNDPAGVQANGDWTSLTSIGIEEDVNRKFDIIAVLADKRAQDAFNAYLKQAKDTDTWPGLERLPEGVTIYVRIPVTRE